MPGFEKEGDFMTHRERFIKTLKCEPIGGQVPTFELVFFLTMEAFGKVHPSHRAYYQWKQMSRSEQTLHMNEMAQLYVDTAKKYGHSAIFIHPNPGDFESTQWLLELIREKSGNEYYIMMHGDPTWAIPDGASMFDFSDQMYEEPEKLNEQSQQRMENMLEFARKLDSRGHLLDGFTLCSDYCFNVNPFFSPDKFEELIVPYLKGVIDGYREMGYYTIKHTDGNIMPIISSLVEAGPHALHSIDPMAGVDIREVKRLYGDKVALCGNVHCAALQTGTDEEVIASAEYCLKYGGEGGGYIFATSNIPFKGMPPHRYEMILDIWKKHRKY